MRISLRIQMILFLILSLMMMNVNAKTTSKGSIHISLEDTENAVSKENVVFGIVKVADIQNGMYVLQSEYEESKINLNEMKTSLDLAKAGQTLYDLVGSKQDFTMQTDKDGKCHIDDLDIGVYLIYALDLKEYDHIDPMLVALPSFDEVESQMKYDLHILPKHYPVLSNIQVKKVNQSNFPLKDATFTLYSDKECRNIVETKATDQNGLATFEDLRRNTYYLKETKAPQGYQISLEVIEISLDSQYDENNIYTLTMENKESPVVNTGDDAPIRFMFAVSVGALGGVITFLIQKKREKK